MIKKQNIGWEYAKRNRLNFGWSLHQKLKLGGGALNGVSCSNSVAWQKCIKHCKTAKSGKISQVET